MYDVCVFNETIIISIFFYSFLYSGFHPVLEHIWEKVEVPKILWLGWINCPYSSLPSWIQLQNVKFLQVYGSELKTSWERENELQVIRNLFY